MKKYFTLLVLLATSLGTMAQNDAEPLGTIYQKFSFTLFDKVVEFKNEDESKNVILSPLSAQMALSMVQNGAANNTLAEIRQVMGTGGYSNEQVNAYNQQLAGSSPTGHHSVMTITPFGGQRKRRGNIMRRTTLSARWPTACVANPISPCTTVSRRS